MGKYGEKIVELALLIKKDDVAILFHIVISEVHFQVFVVSAFRFQ